MGNRFKGRFAFLPDEDPDVHLLSPSSSPLELEGHKLEHLKTAVALGGIANIPKVVLAKQNARLQLSSGPMTGSAMAARVTKRRNNLL